VAITFAAKTLPEPDIDSAEHQRRGGVGRVMEPMLTLKRGGNYGLTMNNETKCGHPGYLHGHSFRVISRNGDATKLHEWRETILLSPRGRVEIASVVGANRTSKGAVVSHASHLVYLVNIVLLTPEPSLAQPKPRSAAPAMVTCG
jgi:hypothetical protein